LVKKGETDSVWKSLIQEFDIKRSSSIQIMSMLFRDHVICELLQRHRSFSLKKVILKKKKSTKADGFITLFTPFKTKWLLNTYGTCTRYTGTATSSNFHKSKYIFPLGEMGLRKYH
jgi:deoxyribodipyrimidine photo-lyase